MKDINPYDPSKATPPRVGFDIQFADTSSGNRIAVATILIALILLPLHPFVPSSISVVIGFVGMLAALIGAVAQSFFAPWSLWRFVVFGVGGLVLFIAAPLIMH